MTLVLERHPRTSHAKGLAATSVRWLRPLAPRPSLTAIRYAANMYIEDLSTKPREPSAANMWARELERDHPGLVTRSVGWLGATVPSSGPVDPVILAALKHYTSWARVEDGWMGLHTCEICDAFSSNGEFWIIWAGVRYVLPEMTVHYVTAHGYRPPEQFLKDLRDKWTTEGILETDFPYGAKALEQRLEANRVPPRTARKPWWRWFW